MASLFKITPLVVFFSVLCMVFTFAKHQDSNQPSYAGLIGVDKLKEDLDLLFKTIEEVHPNMYAYTTKEEFAEYRDELYARIIRPITRPDFYKVVAPVVASLKSGNTFLRPPEELYGEYVKHGGKVFPLSCKWNGQSVILTDNYGTTELPLGSTISMINGETASKVFSRLARWFPAEGKETNLWKLENQNMLPLYMWLEYGPINFFHIQIKTVKGETKRYNVKSLTIDDINENLETRNTELKYEWFSRYIGGYGTYVIRFDTFSHDWIKYLEDTFRKIHQENISNLIIDLRNNRGGSTIPGDSLIRYLTDRPFRQFEQEKGGIGEVLTTEPPFIQPGSNLHRFSGRVFVLIGQPCTSACVSFASAIKCFDIGTLIGEETDESMVSYGKGVTMQMPNSNLEVVIASKHLFTACAKDDGRGILPDYEVKQKSEDIAKDLDTVLQFTLDLISETLSKQTE